jgi:hypothetical protein
MPVYPLLVLLLVSAQRARLGLGSLDARYWPVLDDRSHEGKGGDCGWRWRKRRRPGREIHHPRRLWGESGYAHGERGTFIIALCDSASR